MIRSPRSRRSDAGRPVLIVEPDPTGHHLYYVKLLLDAFNSQGRAVSVLTTRSAVETTEWRTHLASRRPEILILPPTAFALSDVAQAATNLGADLTVLLDGDRYLLPLLRKGWTAPGELSLLVLRADGQPKNPILRHARGAAKKILSWSAGLRTQVRVSALRSPLVHRRGPLRWAPDPVTLACSEDDIRRVRQRLDARGDRYWIGVFGVITPRKNLPLIIQAILDQPDVGLLIAGSLDSDVSQMADPLLAKFKKAGGEVVHLSPPLTDAEFDGAIGAVDCVIAAHSNEGPSGVVLKAAASSKRLVLSGAKSLKRDAASLGELAAWSNLDSESIGQAIRHARSLPKPTTAVELGAEGFVRALTT